MTPDKVCSRHSRNRSGKTLGARLFKTARSSVDASDPDYQEYKEKVGEILYASFDGSQERKGLPLTMLTMGKAESKELET